MKQKRIEWTWMNDTKTYSFPFPETIAIARFNEIIRMIEGDPDYESVRVRLVDANVAPEYARPERVYS